MSGLGYEPRNSQRAVVLRSFSHDLMRETPDEALAQGLSTAVPRDREQERRRGALSAGWAALFLDASQLIKLNIPDEEQILFKQSQALAKAWENFQRRLPPDQRIQYQDQPPSISSLYTAVQKASASWHDKRDGTRWGRMKDVFSRMCSTCDNHSQLFALVPSNDKYITLLTGSLTVFAQTTINHQKVADGLSDNLEKLVTDITFWNNQLKCYTENENMHKILRELYVVVFEFLTEIFTKWSSSGRSRFIGSFDKGLFDRLFTARRAKMEELSRRLNDEARLEEQKKRMLMDQKLDELLKGQRLLQLGISGQRFLEDLNVPHYASASIQGPPGSFVHDDCNAIAEKPSIKLLESASALSQSFKKEDLIQALLHWDIPAVANAEVVQGLFFRATSAHMDSKVVQRLQLWANAADKDNLWIHGPHHVPRPSQNTLTAATIIIAARQSRIPVLSYFCHCAAGGSDDTDSSPSIGLRNLFMSLLLQLVELLPGKFSVDMNLPNTPLEILQTPSCPDDAAMNMLRSLLASAPASTMCVIDGIEDLEDPSDQLHTKRFHTFMSVLCGQDNVPGSAANGKICLTTDGFVDALAICAENGALDKVRYETEADEMGADDCSRGRLEGF